MFIRGVKLMSIIERIISILEIRGLKRADLARHIGKSTGQISMWEKRKSNPPSDMLPKIAEFLNVSVDYLLGKETESTNENDFTYALYDEITHDLSKEQIEQIIKFADFLCNS